MGEKEKPSLVGMTVNERLFFMNLIGLWDKAVQQHDRDAMIALLQQIEVSEPHVTADAVLAEPKKYGF